MECALVLKVVAVACDEVVDVVVEDGVDAVFGVDWVGIAQFEERL